MALVIDGFDGPVLLKQDLGRKLIVEYQGDDYEVELEPRIFSGAWNKWDISYEDLSSIPQLVQRAGVIPYTFHRGKTLYLFGIDNDNKISDFGGGCEAGETTDMCAKREFEEESRRSIPVDLNSATHIYLTGGRNPHQAIYFVPVEYADYTKIFDSTPARNKYEQEMQTFKWIEEKEVKKYNLQMADSVKSLVKSYRMPWITALYVSV